MMKNVKVIGLVSALALMSACSTNSYKIVQEDKEKLTKVPSWYMADFNEKKACDMSFMADNGLIKTDDDGKVCIFGVGTAVSPDLNLAIEKGKMIAKAELADIIKGEMNKQSKQFITELGKNQTKTVVSDVESTLVNIIKETKVRGYEIFEQDVTMTSNGYYRAWIGLRLPMGEFNKMFHYTIEEATDSYNLKEASSEAFKKVVENNEKKDVQ